MVSQEFPCGTRSCRSVVSELRICGFEEGRASARPFTIYLIKGFRVCVRTRVDASLILPERGGAMGKFLDYNPDQAYLLPPSVRDVLGEGHLCFFLRRGVGELNLNAFCDEYGGGGGEAYAPEMVIWVLLEACAV